MITNVHTRKSTVLPFLLVFIALLGLLDATYLSLSTLKGTSLVCGGFGDCTGVTTSEYARILGIPVAYLGFLYYATFFFVSLTLATFKKSRLMLPLFLLSLVGLAASLWFVFVQLILLQLVCLYCMISAGTSTALFLLARMLWRTHTKNDAHSPLSIDSTESEQV